jgi:uncharacterized membrane protein YgcG
MILFLIFLLIFICILLAGHFSRTANRRIQLHRRVRDNSRNAIMDQNSIIPIAPTNELWLHDNAHIPPSDTDNIVSHDSTSGDYVHDLTLASVDSSVNTGSIDSGSIWDSGSSTDSSSGSDFGGFSGDGGDAGGGGAGGDW